MFKCVCVSFPVYKNELSMIFIESNKSLMCLCQCYCQRCVNNDTLLCCYLHSVWRSRMKVTTQAWPLEVYPWMGVTNIYCSLSVYIDTVVNGIRIICKPFVLCWLIIYYKAYGRDWVNKIGHFIVGCYLCVSTIYFSVHMFCVTAYWRILYICVILLSVLCVYLDRALTQGTPL